MFPAGARAAAITVALIDDSTAESAETFTVTLMVDPSSSATLADASATGTIEDDDRSFTLDIAGGDSVGEGGSATFTVTLTPSPPSATPTEEITVDWATADGTATAGADYTSGGATLRFAAGASGSALTQQFTVATTDDTRDENDEDFTVTLSNASGASARIGTDTATATISDDDVPEMSIDDATAKEDAGSIVFDVSLSLASRPADHRHLRDRQRDRDRRRGRRHGLHRAGGGQQHGQVQSRRDHRADQHRPDQTTPPTSPPRPSPSP